MRARYRFFEISSAVQVLWQVVVGEVLRVLVLVANLGHLGFVATPHRCVVLTRNE